MARIDDIREKLQYAHTPDGEVISKIYKKGDEYKYREQEFINCQLKIRGEHVELVYYKEPISVPKHVIVDKDMINSEFTFKELAESLTQRKFKRNEEGVAVPIKNDTLLSDLRRTIERSAKRATHNFYDYALSNRWNYFATFTFADEATRLSKDLLYESWRKFVR